MMSLLEALELFNGYGNVGRSPSDLLTQAPTPSQLKEAVELALWNGRTVGEMSEATLLVMTHFNMKE